MWVGFFAVGFAAGLAAWPAVFLLRRPLRTAAALAAGVGASVLYWVDAFEPQPAADAAIVFTASGAGVLLAAAPVVYGRWVVRVLRDAERAVRI